MTAVSLAAVFANATSGSVAYLRAKRVDLRTAALFSVATVPGAVAGAAVVGVLSRGIFDSLFGAVLTLLSLALLANPDRRLTLGRAFPPTERRELTDAAGDIYRYTFNLPLGMVASVHVARCPLLA